jgi:hypothetical protein
MADPGDLDWWFGGSKNPQDYQKQSQYQDQGQIHDVINQGLNGGNRAAPQAANNSPFAGYQLQQVGQLQRIASGQQQGAGELASQRQVANSQAAQQAMARMARGPNAALAYRNAANNQSQLGLAGAGQAQQAALQDQQSAQGLLTQALGTGRSQDQQMALANLDAQLRMQGMNDQQRQAYLQALLQMNSDQLRVASGQAQNPGQGMLGGLLAAGGTIAGAAIGGPQGAQVGGAAGSGVGNAVSGASR